MNLFLRIVIVWFKALFARRIGVLEAYDTHFTVWWTDQDMLRHVTNSRFFSLTDVCVIDYFLRARVWKTLNRNGWFPLIVYEDMHFLKPLRHPSKFRVRSQFLGWDEDRKGKAVPIAAVAEALKAPPPPPLQGEAAEALARSRAASSASASLAATRLSGAA